MESPRSGLESGRSTSEPDETPRFNKREGERTSAGSAKSLMEDLLSSSQRGPGSVGGDDPEVDL